MNWEGWPPFFYFIKDWHACDTISDSAPGSNTETSSATSASGNVPPIQLSDLQNILSGISVPPDASGSPRVPGERAFVCYEVCNHYKLTRRYFWDGENLLNFLSCKFQWTWVQQWRLRLCSQSWPTKTLSTSCARIFQLHPMDCRPLSSCGAQSHPPSSSR